ncbi:hypothetical protein ACWAUC_19735 [Bradyrhizobium guangdongense]
MIRARQMHVVWCCNCHVLGKLEPATVDWDGIPTCRRHFVEFGGREETPEGAAYVALKSRQK